MVHIVGYNMCTMIFRGNKLTKLEQVLEYCKINKITVENMPMKLNRSLSYVHGTGKSFVAIDNKEMPEFKSVCYLLHEIGHIKTGAMYEPYAPESKRRIPELKACNWAVKNSISKSKLDKCLRKEMPYWEIAEEFGVDEHMIRYAVYYYFHVDGVWDGKLMTAGEKV